MGDFSCIVVNSYTKGTTPVILLILALIHGVVAISAARWWMKPLLLAFDEHFQLPHCKESDFHFFCWAWSVILVLVALRYLWEWTEWFHRWWFIKFGKKS